MSIHPASKIGEEGYREAKLAGRRLANAMLPDVLTVADEAIEGWRTEHTTLPRGVSDEWVAEFLRVLRREALLTLGAKLYDRA